jgi:hypothetical protein
MPVTAKLSRKFYETFGDDLATKLVDWFNQVDATYRGELRELNELHYQRFDAKLEQRIAEVRAELREAVARLENRIDSGLANQRAELIKWMFVFWAGTVIPLAGLILALRKV